MLVNSRFAKSVVATVGLIAAVLMVSIVYVQAASAQSTTSNSANTLKITPVRTDLQIEAGKSGKVDVTVTNLTDKQILVRPIENDFIQGDESGTPSLILDANEYAPTHSLKRFMVPLKDVTIPAKQSKTVTVQINVPANAQAGGYFGALRFAPSTPDSGGQVNLSASVASLILLTVPGPVEEKLNLTDFSILQGGKASTDFRTPSDLKLSFRFENKGNIQLGPFGKISVKQGDKVVYDYDFNNKNPRDVILPDGARRWEVPLEKIGDFGHYTVNATFTYGSKNQSIDIVVIQGCGRVFTRHHSIYFMGRMEITLRRSLALDSSGTCLSGLLLRLSSYFSSLHSISGALSYSSVAVHLGLVVHREVSGTAVRHDAADN